MKNNWRLWALLLLAGLSPLASWADSANGDREHDRRLLEKWQADPEHYSRLRRDLRDFQTLPPERQERLRRLDHDLHAEGAAKSTRLVHTLQRYADWLQRLPKDDRERIENAPDATERLRVIRWLREQEWIEQLPRAQRDELRKLPPVQQPARIAELRRQERERRSEWQTAIRHWDELTRNATPTANLEELKPAIRTFVSESLMPMLSPAERNRLHEAEGRWPLYGQVLVELADKHPILLPGPTTGPTRFEELPLEFQRRMPKLKRAPLPNAQEGKWPEYAIQVTRFARRNSITLPRQLGPSRLTEFSPNVRAFCETKLFPVLTEEERKRRDTSEGVWPAYARAITDLAHKHGLQVPGMGLPGPPALWQRLREDTASTAK
jgi:hypothetical protein